LAEHLAARWIGERLAAEQVRQVLFHPEDPDQVVPQLAGVTVWLAGMKTDVLELLARNAPEYFIVADNSLATDALRAIAVPLTLPIASKSFLTVQPDVETSQVWSLRARLRTARPLVSNNLLSLRPILHRGMENPPPTRAPATARTRSHFPTTPPFSALPSTLRPTSPAPDSSSGFVWLQSLDSNQGPGG
jgi:hypothetical protein